jgi:hypothetical protein
MAVPDGWPSARASGCTEPGLQADSPAAPPLTCGGALPFGSSAVTAQSDLSSAASQALSWQHIAPHPPRPRVSSRAPDL